MKEGKRLIFPGLPAGFLAPGNQPEIDKEKERKRKKEKTQGPKL